MTNAQSTLANALEDKSSSRVTTSYKCSACGMLLHFKDYRWKPVKAKGRKQHQRKCKNLNWHPVAEYSQYGLNGSVHHYTPLRRGEEPLTSKEMVIEPNPGPKRGDELGTAAKVAAHVSSKARKAISKDTKRALEPITAPVKKGLHEARKWADKAGSKVPVLGKIASLPVDIVDDLAQGLLPEVKSKKIKWQVPELVDKLWEAKNPAQERALAQEIKHQLKAKYEPKTANKLAVELNPGPPKKSKRGGKGGRKKKDAKKRGKKTLMGMLLRSKNVRAVRGPRMSKGVKFRNKKTGAVSAGLKMKSSEYLWTTTLASGATNFGDEVLHGGLLINPHELILPELAIEVQRWELYRIRPHIKLESVSNGTVDCELFGYYDPDPTDTIPNDAVRRMQIAETHGGSPGYVSKGHTWTPNSKRIRATAVKWFYCDSAGTTGADVRQSDQYRFRLLVRRAPRLYGYNGGVASSGTVDLTINLRISYEIDFRNRTLDNVASGSAGQMAPMSVYATTGLQTTTGMTGLTEAKVGSNYLITQSASFRRPMIIANGGANDTIYRPYQLGCPKYVLITGTVQASTLSGVPSIGSDVNLTSFYTGFPTAALSSNVCVFSYFYFVDNINTRSTGNFTTPTTILGRLSSWGSSDTSITNLANGPGQVAYNWALNLGNFTTVTTPAGMILTICEFNEGNELAKLNWHGPCTVEGLAYRQFCEIPFNKRPLWAEFLQQYQKNREEKKDEIVYWRNRALGQDFERDAKDEGRRLAKAWSLTPDNSDDENDYKEFLEYKKSVSKPTSFFSKPLKIVQDDEKSEKGSSRAKASSQK